MATRSSRGSSWLLWRIPLPRASATATPAPPRGSSAICAAGRSASRPRRTAAGSVCSSSRRSSRPTLGALPVAAAAGATLEIERSRTLDGPSEKVTVTLAKFYHQQATLVSSRPPAAAGLRVDYSSLAVQRGPINYLSIPEGVLIREVEAGSPADKA